MFVREKGVANIAYPSRTYGPSGVTTTMLVHCLSYGRSCSQVLRKKRFAAPNPFGYTIFIVSRATGRPTGTSGPHRRVRRYSDIKKYPVWCSNVHHNTYTYVYIGTYNTLPTVIIVVVVVYEFLFFFIRI